MKYKRIIAKCLLCVTLININTVSIATDEQVPNEIERQLEETGNQIDDLGLEGFEDLGIEDLGTQLDTLYRVVGQELNLNYIYVKIIHLLAGGKAIYADQIPNIYNEETVETADAPFHIPRIVVTEGEVATETEEHTPEGMEEGKGEQGREERGRKVIDLEGNEGLEEIYQDNLVEAPWAISPDETIQRPSRYYLPDAAYSTSATIVKIMNERFYKDRGQVQNYFTALNIDTRTNIMFTEAVLTYLGADEKTIEHYYSAYEKILYEKERNENVLEVGDDGLYKFKDEFKKILLDNYVAEEYLPTLAIILSFDSKLATSNDLDNLVEEIIMPYKVNYTSRENLMLAVSSVVGKVRYVWGGGHLQTGTLKGINPSWKPFNEEYIRDSTGVTRSIKPTLSWCPIHKKVEKSNGCLFDEKAVTNIETYVDSRKQIFGGNTLDKDRYRTLFKDLSMSGGIEPHRFDGLDCSGFTSWAFNQIQDKQVLDYTARWFTPGAKFKHIDYGDPMLPGDVFAWDTHILMIVGKIKDSSRAYVMVEASPNTVKYGVIYYTGVKTADLDLAVSVAREANSLIGNLPKSEKTHIYNMDNVGYNSGGERYAEIGRYPYHFIDENTIINGKRIKEMNAIEILQNTVDNLPYNYISGYETYNGKHFTLDKVEEKIVIENLSDTSKEIVIVNRKPKNTKQTRPVNMSKSDKEEYYELVIDDGLVVVETAGGNTGGTARTPDTQGTIEPINTDGEEYLELLIDD